MTREPIQAKDARKTSDATLESRYRDLRRLRDEVRKAETKTIYARRRSKKTSGSEATCSSVGLSDQQFVDFLS
jgi:hypothetical protein